MAHNEKVSAVAGPSKGPKALRLLDIMRRFKLSPNQFNKKKLQMKEKVQGIFYLAEN
jgi:hypothetical protein